MTRRMWIAVLALGGFFLAAYLTLYHYGYVGQIACGSGGCETVQASRYGKFLGYPVALWGAGYYASVFALATAAAVGPFTESKWPVPALVLFNGWSVLFSGYLTWAELFKINAICRYCVVSAALVLVLFVLSVLEWRASREAGSIAAT
ncbi:MAG: vitamin K epoxide reductase family protein [Gemmatimonadetes bacterium]|nr:vitamin K epoxide reductase family protein [Gemmatimonadota bacterium]